MFDCLWNIYLIDRFWKVYKLDVVERGEFKCVPLRFVSVKQYFNSSFLLFSFIAGEDKSSNSSVIVPGTLRQSTHKIEYWNIYKTSCGVARRAMLRAQRERNRLGFCFVKILKSINLMNRKERLREVYSISQGHRHEQRFE